MVDQDLYFQVHGQNSLKLLYLIPAQRYRWSESGWAGGMNKLTGHSYLGQQILLHGARHTVEFCKSSVTLKQVFNQGCINYFGFAKILVNSKNIFE